ncbi:MAG: hypothetical protein HY867_03960 [Chloroflexi bacterium]|nr:hypothetical protein [Chloroflexota bacterium]
MTNNEPQKQTFNDPLWPATSIISVTLIAMMFSPFLGILLGLILLFLNWLRMGKPKKVFLVFLLSVFVFVLWVFTDYGRSSVQILDKWEPLTIVGQIALLLSSLGILVLIGGNDLRKFREQAQESKQISKWMGLPLLFFLFSAYVFGWVGLDLLSQRLGYCKIPTIYELVAEYQESHSEGLGGLLAQRKDLGCDWRWNNETDLFSTFSLPGERKFLDGIHDDDRYYHIEQIILGRDVYDPSAMDAFPSLDGETLAINIQKVPQADFYESNCVGNGIISECTLIVGFDHLVYGLNVRGMLFSDSDHFEVTINTILESAVARIVEYEISLP